MPKRKRGGVVRAWAWKGEFSDEIIHVRFRLSKNELREWKISADTINCGIVPVEIHELPPRRGKERR